MKEIHFIDGRNVVIAKADAVTITNKKQIPEFWQNQIDNNASNIEEYFIYTANTLTNKFSLEHNNRGILVKDIESKTDTYLVGQAEAQLDIVPGLMPESYILGRLDAKTKKHPDKNKPGFDWVADPSVKDGGYYRKAKSSAGSTVAKIAAAAVLAGAGAAAIASADRKSTATPPRSPIPATLPVKPIIPKTTNLNKKAVAAAGVVGAAGVSAIAANRMQNVRSAPKPQSPESKMPANTKVQYKQVSDPWSSTPDVPDPWDDAPKPASGQSSANPQNAQLPPARYIQRKPQEPDPWEAQTSNSRAMSEQSSAATAMSDTIPALPPAKPVIYKRPFVAKTRKLRETINLAKRERTGLAKAQENLEYGQYLQTKTGSQADVNRGKDVEINAKERIANLQARSPTRTTAGLATVRGRTNRNSVKKASGSFEATAADYGQEAKTRKKKEQAKNEALAEAQEKSIEDIPFVQTSKGASTTSSATPEKASVLETGELPTRGEIVQGVGQSAFEQAKEFGKMVKTKGLKGAVLQRAQNSRDRRQKLIKQAAQVGIDVPGAIENTKSTAIEKTTEAAKQLAIEEGPPLAGSIVGGIIGGSVAGYPGYLAGDLAGTAIVRKAQLDIEATRKAQAKLQTSVNYRNASEFEKLKMLGVAAIAELKTPEMQAKIKQKRKEDLAGWAIGNVTGKVGGYNPLIAGGLAAATTKPVVQAAESATQAVKTKGVVGAASYFIKSAATAPKRAIASIKAGNQRERELRENTKRAILAAKAMRNVTPKSDTASQTWVKDPRKRRGGYWRRTRKGFKKVGGAIASQLLGAAVVGTGAALATHHAIETGKKKAHVAANDVAQKFGKQVNKTAIAGAAIGGLAIGAAGTAAIAAHQKRKDSTLTGKTWVKDGRVKNGGYYRSFKRKVDRKDIKLVTGKGNKGRGGENGGEYWHIKHKGKRVGHVYVNVINQEPIGKHASLSIHINQQHRNKGIGSSAYKKASDASRHSKIYLHMRKSNTASIKAASNAGFSVAKTPKERQLTMLLDKTGNKEGSGVGAIAAHHKRKDATEQQEELMHSVMSRYKKRKLHIGRSKYKVKSRKQAITIGLNVSGQSRHV